MLIARSEVSAVGEAIAEASGTVSTEFSKHCFGDVFNAVVGEFGRDELSCFKFLKNAALSASNVSIFENVKFTLLLLRN